MKKSTLSEGTVTGAHKSAKDFETHAPSTSSTCDATGAAHWNIPKVANYDLGSLILLQYKHTKPIRLSIALYISTLSEGTVVTVRYYNCHAKCSIGIANSRIAV